MELTYSFTVWSAEGLPVRVVDDLDLAALKVELAPIVDTDEAMAMALSVRHGPADVALQLPGGAQLEVGSRPI